MNDDKMVHGSSTRPDDGADDSSSSSSAAATGNSLCCSSPLHDRDADTIGADGTTSCPSSPRTCGSHKLDGTPPSSPATRTHVRSRSSSGAAVSPLVSPAVGPVDGVVAAAGRNGGEVGPTQQYSVGYVSMSILLLISCANLVFNFAPGVSRSDVKSSSSTVDPSKVSSTSALSGRKLAPAAIHSLTEALGPILPFVGGNDLRRDDASVWDLVWPSDGTDRWDELDWSWWSPLPWSKVGMGDSGDDFQGEYVKPSSGSGVDVASRVGRGGAQRDPSSNKKGSQKRKKSRSGVNHPKRDAAISASEPFLSPEEIGKLTLSDVTDVFHYAIHANRPGFDRTAFLKGLSPETRRAVEAMDDAVLRSRGPGVQPALTHRSSSFTSDEEDDDENGGSTRSRFGDIDALQFCAAMRIFAEWRVVRQVPEGYKAYSVGMGLGHKDVVQNLVKVEAAIHDRQDLRREALALRSGGEPDEQEEGSEENKDQDEDDDGVLRSPTLRQLLEGEIDLGLHAKLPRLKERSAAMGLLWVRRQLHYQSRIFSNVRSAAADGDDGRKQFPTTKDAVEAAYREVYDSYHGWAVQKIFNYSFQAAPPAGEIFKFMNPAYLREVMERARTIGRDADDEDLFDRDGGDGYASSSVETSVRRLSPMSNEEGGTGEILDERREMFIIGGNSAAWGGAAGSGAMMTVTFTAHTVSETLTVVDDMTEEWSGGEKKSNGSNPWERLGNHIGSEWDRLTNHVGSEWDRAARHVGSEWDKLANHVGSEWDKAARNVLRFLKIDRGDGGGRSKGGGNVGDPSSAGGERERGLRGEELDRYVMEEMMRSARREFGTHLEVAEPLLDDLAGLFAELNMDDPTKV